MFNAVIINEIRDSVAGKVYKIGDRVRVEKKPRVIDRPCSEFIGTIQNIYADKFILIVDGDPVTIELENLEKMRLAKPGETFDNTIYFDDDVKLFRVVAIRKADKSITKNILVSVTEARAEKFCEQWGWSYDEDGHSYWLSIEPMAD